jgi:hypothetical protein
MMVPPSAAPPGRHGQNWLVDAGILPAGLL